MTAVRSTVRCDDDGSLVSAARGAAGGLSAGVFARRTVLTPTLPEPLVASALESTPFSCYHTRGETGGLSAGVLACARVILIPELRHDLLTVPRLLCTSPCQSVGVHVD